MRIRTNLSLFAKELLLFSVAMSIGLYVATNSILLEVAGTAIEPLEFSWVNIVLMLSVFLVVSFILTRCTRVSRVLFVLFFFLVMFSGSQLVGTMIWLFPWNMIFALAVIVLTIVWRSVLTHDLAVIFGLSGIAAILGLSITPIAALLILVLFSAYDIIAVYKTQHMMRMARTMLESGAVFGFIIPAKWRDFFAHRDDAQLGERFMMLGSGDIGLPIVFAASIARVSLPSAIIVAVSSVIGLFITHLLFMNQARRRPMAALPPIVTMCTIGYMIASLFVN